MKLQHRHKHYKINYNHKSKHKPIICDSKTTLWEHIFNHFLPVPTPKPMPSLPKQQTTVDDVSSYSLANSVAVAVDRYCRRLAWEQAHLPKEANAKRFNPELLATCRNIEHMETVTLREEAKVFVYLVPWPIWQAALTETESRLVNY